MFSPCPRELSYYLSGLKSKPTKWDMVVVKMCYKTVIYDQVFWLDKSHMRVDKEYNITGMYHSTSQMFKSLRRCCLEPELCSDWPHVINITGPTVWRWVVEFAAFASVSDQRSRRRLVWSTVFGVWSPQNLAAMFWREPQPLKKLSQIQHFCTAGLLTGNDWEMLRWFSNT